MMVCTGGSPVMDGLYCRYNWHASKVCNKHITYGTSSEGNAINLHQVTLSRPRDCIKGLRVLYCMFIEYFLLHEHCAQILLTRGMRMYSLIVHINTEIKYYTKHMYKAGNSAK